MRYRVENGWVDTESAVRSWPEARDWNGQNWLSRPTGSQWHHETLHLSKNGQYWLESSSDWQGSRSTARILYQCEAADWLLLNDHSLPDDLAKYGDSDL